MINLKDLTVYGQMKKVQVSPQQGPLATCMVIKQGLLMSLRSRSGTLALGIYSQSLDLMVCGTLSAVPNQLVSYLSKCQIIFFSCINHSSTCRNPEEYSQMSKLLTIETRERWDLFNEINRTKKKLSLEGMDEVRKKASLDKFE